jgi:HSP20 family molecular chaperone IbpA
MNKAMTKTQPTQTTTAREARKVAPPVDIYENAEKLLLIADVPGVEPDGVDIRFEKGRLTFTGKRSEAPAGELLAAEYARVDYERTFALPQGIDADAISAELDKGVLRIHLPKSAALRPRRIEVKTS